MASVVAQKYRLGFLQQTGLPPAVSRALGTQFSNADEMFETLFTEARRLGTMLLDRDIGDVSGPDSARDNAIAVFDGPTGMRLKDSGVLVNDLAPKVSPAFLGIPTAPTAAPGTDSTQIATTAFVTAAVTAGTSGGVTHTGGALTAHAVVLGAGTGDITVMASLGTTTTVLHGNASGNPTWSAVSLATDVTGSLPQASVTNLVSDLALKAPLASPAFTGTPTAPTATAGTNTTQLATTAFVTSAVSTSMTGATGTVLIGTGTGSSFSANPVVTTIAIGTNPATTGSIRLPNAGYMYARNAATSADLLVIGIDANNIVIVGDSGVPVRAYSGTIIFGSAAPIGAPALVAFGAQLAVRRGDNAADAALSASSFVTSNVTMSGSFVSVGPNPATSGEVRLPANGVIASYGDLVFGLNIGTGGQNAWTMSGSAGGHFYPMTALAGAIDIGTASNPIRTLYATTSVKWGNTSAAPLIKRTGTALNVRLADDSADAAITAATAAPGTNTTQLATTAFVTSAVSTSMTGATGTVLIGTGSGSSFSANPVVTTVQLGADVILSRAAANNLALVNGANDQQFTISSGSSSRGVVKIYGDSVTNKAPVISFFRAGNREHIIAGADDGSLMFANTGGLANWNDTTLNTAAQWKLDSFGRWIAGTDNTYDIGAAGANRPKDVYLAGRVILPPTALSTAASQIQFYGSGTVIGRNGGGIYYDLGAGTTFQMHPWMNVSYSPLLVDTSTWLAFGAAVSSGNVGDARIYRDAAGTLAQRFDTNPQTFNIYNTYTNSSNYERLKIGWSSNQIYLMTDQAGTGVARNYVFGTSGAASMFFMIANTPVWYMNPSGHFLAGADNTYDIGVSGANRPRHVYVAGNLTVSGNTVSPTMTGTPTAPTATAGTNTTQVATTAFVTAAVSNIFPVSLTTQVTGTLQAAQAPAFTGDVSSSAGSLALTIGAGKVTNAMLAGSITAANLVQTDIVIAESQVTSLVSDLALKAPLASPALTGTPTAPTASVGTNTTQLATTAFVLTNADVRHGCALWNSGSQTLATGTFTAATFDNENFDTDNYHSTVSNTSRITIPSGLGGQYLIGATLSFMANATGQRIVLLVKNGAHSTQPSMGYILPSSSGTYVTGMTTMAIFDLVAGDYVEVWGYQNSGGNLDIGLGTGTWIMNRLYATRLSS